MTKREILKLLARYDMDEVVVFKEPRIVEPNYGLTKIDHEGRAVYFSAGPRYEICEVEVAEKEEG